jgi:hypothetical protein
MSARHSLGRVFCTLAILSLALTACGGDLPNAPEPIEPRFILPTCPPEEPGCENPGSTPPPWPYFAPAGDFVYDVPSRITPQYCFADLNPTVSAYRDNDKDWLADECELELAKAFAPLLWFAVNEPCPGGEPAWAAKFFNVPRVVRIVYLPAYYEDCGRPQFGFGGGHAGDSELILVEAIFDAATARWKINQMYLSAHEGEGIGERSAWVMPSEVRREVRNGVLNPHPSVWVSERKHANYRSKEVCRKPLIDFEDCDYEGVQLRFPVQQWRNLGSRHSYMMDCVVSTGRYAHTSVRECFWSGRTVRIMISGFVFDVLIFGGWHPDGDLFGGQPGPYSKWLLSQFFEQRCGRGLYQEEQFGLCMVPLDPGPGPNPPGSSTPPPPDAPPPTGCDPMVFYCEEPM